nr:hypothetical protein [uncultured Gellertiella sp.]
MTMTESRSASLFPEVTSRLIITIILAGVAADLSWEVWARFITPIFVGGPLEPAGLVQTVFGLSSRALAELIHGSVGIIFYPIGYLFIARPLQRLIFPSLPLLLTGIGFGTGLWVFALYVMAHLIGGLPAFLGFIPLTWASLVGHIIFGVVVAFVVKARND